MAGQDDLEAALGLELPLQLERVFVDERLLHRAADAKGAAVDPAVAGIEDDHRPIGGRRRGARGRRRRGTGDRQRVARRRGGEGGGLATLELDRESRRRGALGDRRRLDLGDAGRLGKVDHHPRLARPEQAEAESFDDRLSAVARPADRRVDLEADFGHVDDDAVGIDQRARIGGDRTGEIEDELRRLAVVGESRRHRHRRRLVGERRRGSRQAGREPRGRQSKGRQLLAKGHRSSAVSAPFLAQ